MFWFFMPIPKSMSKGQRELAWRGYLKHIKKPDVDNLVKLYLDVLTGTALQDDNAVCLGMCLKVYSIKPRVEIFIEETEQNVTMNEVWEGTWPTQTD